MNKGSKRWVILLVLLYFGVACYLAVAGLFKVFKGMIDEEKSLQFEGTCYTAVSFLLLGWIFLVEMISDMQKRNQPILSLEVLPVLKRIFRKSLSFKEKIIDLESYVFPFCLLLIGIILLVWINIMNFPSFLLLFMLFMVLGALTPAIYLSMLSYHYKEKEELATPKNSGNELESTKDQNRTSISI